jgi:hypothetical protein
METSKQQPPAGLAKQDHKGGAVPIKDFWRTCAKAMADWPTTARMCVLITVASLDLVFIHWLLAH